MTKAASSPESNSFAEKYAQYLEQRKTRCAYGICGNKPVEEFEGERYCRRCVKYARQRAKRRAYLLINRAAPDMLAALEAVTAWWDHRSCPPELVEQVRSAIARARGKAGA